MKFHQVHESVREVPYIKEHNAKTLYSFILKNKPQNILELGVAHGTATCYMAAALDELGQGKIDSVDLFLVRHFFKPKPEEQLAKLNLSKYVNIHRMKTGYNWFLHNQIKERSENSHKVCIPKYDLILIDGPKNWTIDSSSFFLCDKLLNNGGWIIWDDYLWTYKDVKDRDITDGVVISELSEDERNLPHIQEIFHLLVMQHSNYGNFKIGSDWVWARKKRMGLAGFVDVQTSKLKRKVPNKLKSKVKRIIRYSKFSL